MASATVYNEMIVNAIHVIPDFSFSLQKPPFVPMLCRMGPSLRLLLTNLLV